MLKPIYEAEASILITPKENKISSIFSNLGMNVPELSNLNLPMLNSGSSNTADLISILRSRKMAETVIRSLKIDKYPEIYDKDTKTFQAVVENFQRKVKVFAPTGKDSTLRVKARFEDKSIALKIVNKHFYELKRFLEKNDFNIATRNRKFIQTQLYKTSEELKLSEVALLNFKKTNKTVSLSDEVTEYIKYISDLEAQELKSRIELKDISERIKASNELVSDFNTDMQNVIREMEISQAALKTREEILKMAKDKYYTLLNALPNKALFLARLEREVKIKNTLFLMFTQQFEIAKLEEAKETEPFKYLDSGYVNDQPVFPRKIVIIVVAFLISFILSIMFSFFIEYIRVQRRLYLAHLALQNQNDNINLSG